MLGVPSMLTPEEALAADRALIEARVAAGLTPLIDDERTIGMIAAVMAKPAKVSHKGKDIPNVSPGEPSAPVVNNRVGVGVTRRRRVRDGGRRWTAKPTRPEGGDL